MFRRERWCCGVAQMVPGLPSPAAAHAHMHVQSGITASEQEHVQRAKRAAGRTEAHHSLSFTHPWRRTGCAGREPCWASFLRHFLGASTKGARRTVHHSRPSTDTQCRTGCGWPCGRLVPRQTEVCPRVTIIDKLVCTGRAGCGPCRGHFHAAGARSGGARLRQQGGGPLPGAQGPAGAGGAPPAGEAAARDDRPGPRHHRPGAPPVPAEAQTQGVQLIEGFAEDKEGCCVG